MAGCEVVFKRFGLSSARRSGAGTTEFPLKGFTVDDLVSAEFMAALKEVFPSAVVPALVIGFTDSEDVISISHDRMDRRYVAKGVGVQAKNPVQKETVEKLLNSLTASRRRARNAKRTSK
jgi:hypothetical protein